MKLIVRLERKGSHTAEAEAAIAAAEAHLAAVLKRGPEVTESVQKLKEIQEGLILQGRFRDVIYQALSAEVESGSIVEIDKDGRHFSWELTQRAG